MASPADAKMLARTAVRDLEAATTLDKRIKAAEALDELARAGHGREVVQAGGARPLLALLASPSDELLAAAAGALIAVCREDLRLEIAAAGAGEAIGAALAQQPLSPQRWQRLVDMVLVLIAKASGEFIPEVSRQLALGLLRHPGSLEQLMRVAEGGGGAGQQLEAHHSVAAIILLWQAASVDAAAVAALRPSLAAFVQLLASADGLTRCFAARLLGALTDQAELRPRLAAAGAVAALLQAMQQAHAEPQAQFATSFAVGALCQDCSIARQATDAGAVQALVAVLRAHQPPPPGSPVGWSADGAKVSFGAAEALGVIVREDSRAAVQAVQAGAAPLLAPLLRPPGRQTLALAQRAGWAEELDQALRAAGWAVAQLCNCWPGESGQGIEAGAARRALRAEGALGLLTERLRACPAGDDRAWAQAAEPLAAVIEVGDTGGGAASAGQPGPLGQEDAAALELLLQGLLSASEPEQQAWAARGLALLLGRSGSSEVAAHLAQHGALGRARQLAASSPAGAEALESAQSYASLLLQQLEELVEPEELEALEQRWQEGQQEGLRARAAGAGPARPGAAAGGSAPGMESAAAAAGGAASSSVCAGCGMEASGGSGGAKLRRCGGCRAVHYCSPACQKAHWQAHRAACKAAQGAK
jgi:hypothetical protein